MTLTVVVLLASIGAAPADAAESLLAAERALSAGDLEQADRALAAALAADPENVDALQAAALVALQLGDAARAVALLERALALDPNNDDARIELARALAQGGDLAKSRATIAAVLERHPRLISALSLDKEIRAGAVSAPSRPSPWRFSGRAGLSTLYDSNISLDAGRSRDVSHQRAALLDQEAAAAVGHAAGPLPATLFVQLRNTTPLSNQDIARKLAPSIVLAGLVGTHAIGDLSLGVDARYQELFTDGFGTHLQQLLSPSLFAGYRVAGQDLRLLVGVERRRPYGVFGSDLSLTTKATLRDTLALGALSLTVDVAGRRDRSGAANTAGAELRTDFDELDATLYAEYAAFSHLAAFVAADLQARKFDTGLKESTYNGLAGGRYELGLVELHAEYSFTKNLSDALHSYDRHQVTFGVRAYYE
ncbi:MAG: tetratricopeptide repeat protein [Deltaproteobacteria bacterium]|nr:tetratricopeptide repeat protein [Deltaproteobacteria bacterium]